MIDMDDLIGDSDFFTGMTVWRRQFTYDNNGQRIETADYVYPPLSGSIQSGANPELIRAPEMSTVSDLITIYTGGVLRCAGDTQGNDPEPDDTAETDLYGNATVPAGTIEFKSDVVMYHGDPYEVFLIQDWTDYGAGFIAAIAKKVSRAQVAM